jgi:hypothetical protein
MALRSNGLSISLRFFARSATSRFDVTVLGGTREFLARWICWI